MPLAGGQHSSESSDMDDETRRPLLYNQDNYVLRGLRSYFSSLSVSGLAATNAFRRTISAHISNTPLVIILLCIYIYIYSISFYFSLN